MTSKVKQAEQDLHKEMMIDEHVDQPELLKGQMQSDYFKNIQPKPKPLMNRFVKSLAKNKKVKKVKNSVLEIRKQRTCLIYGTKDLKTKLANREIRMASSGGMTSFHKKE
jgi:hypothetical protein